MPHADEALKSLVARFKEDPGSRVFAELATALLARGHASEALRIAEHGLQLMPDNAEGRVERAAALLALGRPRVAFVELKRALAINPSNRRAMRLLGKAYVDAGAPARAAELLKLRSQASDGEDGQEPTRVAPTPPASNGSAATELGLGPAPTIPRGDTAPLQRREAQAAPEPPAPARPPAVVHRSLPVPDLFSDLTRDLGLGDMVPESPMSRVEVTQIIRRKKDRQPRSPSQLMMIEGPIVDTTQPGQITENTDSAGETPSLSMAGEPPPLFDAVTSPRLQLAPFGLDDEPLFQEHMPFAVRPVDGAMSEAATVEAAADPLADLRETFDEEAPPELDQALRDALGAALPATAPDATRPAFTAPVKGASDVRFTEPGDTLVEGIEESPSPPEAVSTAVPEALHGKDEQTPVEPMKFDESPRYEAGMRPLLELSRPSRRLVGQPKLELVEPRATPRDVMLAAIGGFVMIVALLLFFATTPAPWRPSSAASQGGAAGHEEGAAGRLGGQSPLANEASGR